MELLWPIDLTLTYNQQSKIARLFSTVGSTSVHEMVLNSYIKNGSKQNLLAPIK